MSDSKKYVFSFVGGGWNSVYALDLNDAKRRIYEEYECDGYKIRYDSVNLSQDEDTYNDLLNTFL
jgi:hypothetical protein